MWVSLRMLPSERTTIQASRYTSRSLRRPQGWTSKPFYRVERFIRQTLGYERSVYYASYQCTKRPRLRTNDPSKTRTVFLGTTCHFHRRLTGYDSKRRNPPLDTASRSDPNAAKAIPNDHKNRQKFRTTSPRRVLAYDVVVIRA